MVDLNTRITLWFYYEGQSVDPYPPGSPWSGTLEQFFENNHFYDEGIGGRSVLNKEGRDIINQLNHRGVYFKGGGQAPIWEIRIAKR